MVRPLCVTAMIDPPGLVVDGDVDGPAVGVLRNALATLVTVLTDVVVYLDVTAMTFLNLAGLRAILDTAAALAERGRVLVVVNLAEHLRAVLRLVGWDAAPGLLLRWGPPGRDAPVPGNT